MWFKKVIVSSSFLLLPLNALAIDYSQCLKDGEKCLKELKAIPNKLASKTIELLKKQCDRDKDYSCLWLGHYYDKPSSLPLAEKYFRVGCSNKYAKACLEGGYFLERQGREAESDELYQFACSFPENQSESCLALAQNFREKQRWDIAFKYYQMACANDSVRGCLNAAEIAHSQSNYKDDLKFKYLKKACDLDSGYGCYLLGELLMDREFPEPAKEYFKKACLKDNEYACERFKEVNKRGLGEEYVEKFEEVKKEFIQKLSSWFESVFPLNRNK